MMDLNLKLSLKAVTFKKLKFVYFFVISLGYFFFLAVIPYIAFLK